jgi:hypothetical protein
MQIHHNKMFEYIRIYMKWILYHSYYGYVTANLHVLYNIYYPVVLSKVHDAMCYTMLCAKIKLPIVFIDSNVFLQMILKSWWWRPSDIEGHCACLFVVNQNILFVYTCLCPRTGDIWILMYKR